MKTRSSKSSSRLSRFELRLSLVQLVVVLGLTAGMMFLAFLAGYSAGQGVGYDVASTEALLKEPRQKLPLTKEEEQIADKVGEEVYARLSETSPIMPEDPVDEESLEVQPPLGTSPSMGGSAVSLGEVAESLNEAEAIHASKEQPDSERLKDSKQARASGRQATLAAIVPKEEELNKIIESSPAVKKITVDPPKAATSASASTIVKEQARREEDLSTIQQKSAQPAPGWYAQVAAPSSQKEAHEMASRLAGSGFRTSIEEAVVRGQKYYRVLVGPEESQVYAYRLVEQLQREPYIRSKPFVKLQK